LGAVAAEGHFPEQPRINPADVVSGAETSVWFAAPETLAWFGRVGNVGVVSRIPRRTLAWGGGIAFE
jgi:hypothetical protein